MGGEKPCLAFLKYCLEILRTTELKPEVAQFVEDLVMVIATIVSEDGDYQLMVFNQYKGYLLFEQLIQFNLSLHKSSEKVFWVLSNLIAES